MLRRDCCAGFLLLSRAAVPRAPAICILFYCTRMWQERLLLLMRAAGETCASDAEADGLHEGLQSHCTVHMQTCTCACLRMTSR